MEIQTPYPLPHILHVPVPDFHKLGPMKMHSSSLEETKQELRVLIIKNNNNKNKELRLSLGHMWGMMQRIKEVKLACMASAEESPGLHCGVGRKQKRAEVGEEQLVSCEERLGVGVGRTGSSAVELKPGIMVRGQGHEVNICRKKSHNYKNNF